MPGYKVCYFIEQGRGLNLNKIESVHVSEHLIYITVIITHLWVSGSLISINCVLPQGFKFLLWLLIRAAIFCLCDVANKFSFWHGSAVRHLCSIMNP